MIIKLIRVSSIEDGTFGVLKLGEIPFALTLEETWRDNEQNVSCIPSGDYICKRKISAKFGETFEVKDVPDRTDILFHKGNTDTDTEGCILVGEEFTRMNGKIAVGSSGRGYSEFMSIMKNVSEFELRIRWGCADV